MHGYDGKNLARSFRTVRKNTIQIAEEIPEDRYGFRPAEGSRSKPGPFPPHANRLHSAVPRTAGRTRIV